MRIRSILHPHSLLYLLFAGFTAIAQQADDDPAEPNEEPPPQYGFLELINAIPSDARLNVTIDGKELVRDGIRSGAATGGFLLPVGSHQATFSIEGIPSREGKLEVELGVTKTYVIYPKKNEGKDAKENPIILSLRKIDGPLKKSGYAVVVTSFCPNKEQIKINKKTVELEFAKTQEFSGWAGGPMQVFRQDKKIGVFLVEEKGTYHLIVATDHQGRYLSSFVRILNYEVPPWFQTEK